MDLKYIIRGYKEKNNLSNIEIAERFQVTHITVGRWLRGEVKTIQEETAQKISSVLGYDVQALLQGNALNLRRPILGQAKAGYDLFYDENYIGEEHVSLDEYNHGDYFLNVVGDSMINAGIKSGGLVYVKNCNEVRNGEIAIIAIGTEEVTIKTFYKEKDHVVLKASNPVIGDRVFSLQEVHELPIRVIGKVLFSKNYM